MGTGKPRPISFHPQRRYLLQQSLILRNAYPGEVFERARFPAEILKGDHLLHLLGRGLDQDTQVYNLLLYFATALFKAQYVGKLNNLDTPLFSP